MKERVISDRNH